MLIEFALFKEGHTKELRIRDKEALARSGISNSILSDCDSIVWNSILETYVATIEHRHALVHRQAEIDSNGNLHAYYKDGRPLKILRQSEQISFAKAAFILAESVIAESMNSRANEHLKYYLNELSEHTTKTINCRAAIAPVIMRITLTQDDDGLYLDIGGALAVTNMSNSEHYIDVYIDIPEHDQKILFAHAEDCPKERTIIELDNLPSWLTLRNC